MQSRVLAIGKNESATDAPHVTVDNSVRWTCFIIMSFNMNYVSTSHLIRRANGTESENSGHSAISVASRRTNTSIECHVNRFVIIVKLCPNMKMRSTHTVILWDINILLSELNENASEPMTSLTNIGRLCCRSETEMRLDVQRASNVLCTHQHNGRTLNVVVIVLINRKIAFAISGWILLQNETRNEMIYVI